MVMLNTITSDEATEMLRVSAHTTYRQLRAGKLPGGKIGIQWRLPKGEIEALLRDRSTVMNKAAEWEGQPK